MSIQDRIALVNLRVSVARIAQGQGVSLAKVGLPDDASFEAIREAAETVERGWNELAAQLTQEGPRRAPLAEALPDGRYGDWSKP